MRTLEEHLQPGEIPLWRQPEWVERFPWLVQATTGAPADLGLAGAQPVGETLDRWRALRRLLGVPSAIHSRQVHGSDLLETGSPLPPGLLVTEGFDGHITDRAGAALTVAVADCVPVFLVDPSHRAVAMVHAGWRGVAAGIVEAAVARLGSRFGARPGDLWAHAGPAICGACYEVGPEVHRAVWPDREAPAGPTPIDLREAIGARLARLGLADARISRSAYCTRCGPGEFFSHRSGSAARQMGVIARLA
ncbi:MAG TPA: polyphenol oxidase family protein [Longimicrobiaceae bacterium]|nr:polyphenol oxidase family protein [Longimicrobiaceae bacterium]